MRPTGKSWRSCNVMRASRWTILPVKWGPQRRKLREAGVIGQQTVVLDSEALGFEACFFVLIRTSEHEAAWQAAFLKALQDRPEVQEAHRLAGDIDYILKVRVKNARAYDVFYQALISEVKVHNVTALLSMEEIKSTTMLPL
jgi:Lrp/AsnC family transcriptional regulator